MSHLKRTTRIRAPLARVYELAHDPKHWSDWYVGVSRYRMQLITEGAPVIPKITQPTYVLWGAHDPVLKVAWADRLDEYFETFRFEQAEDAGHFVHFERPDLANERMLGFFAEALS